MSSTIGKMCANLKQKSEVARRVLLRDPSGCRKRSLEGEKERSSGEGGVAARASDAGFYLGLWLGWGRAGSREELCLVCQEKELSSSVQVTLRASKAQDSGAEGLRSQRRKRGVWGAPGTRALSWSRFPERAASVSSQK